MRHDLNVKEVFAVRDANEDGARDQAEHEHLAHGSGREARSQHEELHTIKTQTLMASFVILTSARGEDAVCKIWCRLKMNGQSTRMYAY